jgi:hypothetical protein
MVYTSYEAFVITLDLTTFLAILGAVTGTSALFWDFYKWRTSGPRLKVEALSGYIAATPNPVMQQGKTYTLVSVTNRGDRPTTLEQVSGQYFETENMRSGREKFIVIPQSPNPLPFLLEPGRSWQGMISEDKLFNRQDRKVVKLCMKASHSDNLHWATPLKFPNES